MFAKIFNTKDYRRRENDKDIIKRLINDYHSKYYQEMQSTFDFRIYGLENFREKINKEYLTDFNLKRLSDFIRYLSSSITDISLMKAVREYTNNPLDYNQLVLFTEFIIDTTNISLEFTKILENYQNI